MDRINAVSWSDVARARHGNPDFEPVAIVLRPLDRACEDDSVLEENLVAVAGRALDFGISFEGADLVAPDRPKFSELLEDVEARGFRDEARKNFGPIDEGDSIVLGPGRAGRADALDRRERSIDLCVRPAR